MLTSIWNFLKRHKRKFVVTGAIVGGAVLLGKYAQRKITEIQERETAECLAHARRQHHFDSNQRTCNTTVLSMLPGLRDALLQALDTESLTAELKTKPANKIEIWEDLKVLSFTRTMVSVYCSCMLIIMLRVQLNIIGGYIYLDSISSKGAEEETVATAAVQKEYYASSIQHLLGQGLVDLVNCVRSAVEKEVKSISLKQQMTLLDIQDVMNKIRVEVEQQGALGGGGVSIANLTQFILPEDQTGNQATRMTLEDQTMDHLMNETRDMIDSSDFQMVLGTCLDVGFTRLLDKLADYYKPLGVEEDDNAAFSLNTIHMPMAKVIPIMNGMIHTICGDTPNQFIQELLLKEQVRDFAANVYEAFSQPDAADRAQP